MKFTNEDWQRIERDWMSWWNHEIERPMVVIVSPHMYTQPQEFSHLFMAEMPLDNMLNYYQSRLETTSFIGDAWPRWMPDFGPGIIAGFLGASVNMDEKMNTVWFGLEKEPDISELHLTFDENNFWWQRIKQLTTKAARRWGATYNLAHSDIGANLDILAAMVSTEKLLVALVDSPNEVERLLTQITNLWKQYYSQCYDIIKSTGRGTSCWASLWSAERFYMLQSDFSYMISPRMFERFVLPDLDELCRFLDHPFYHLDGVGQLPHLDMLLSLEKLKGIQWIPGSGQPPAENWLDLLKKIRDAGKLCQLYLSAKGAMKIVQELGGKGFAFYIQDDFRVEDAEEFLQVINKVS